MGDELRDECGIAAVYHWDLTRASPLHAVPNHASRLIPRMLLDIQNRGQLAAGMTCYDPSNPQLLQTLKDVGSVSEVFRLSHPGKRESLMQRYNGHAAIGHVRYATCGVDDRDNAQPFERHHLQRHKWFCFGFNGQLANYPQLRDEILRGDDYHLSRDTDTEILMHLLSREMSGDRRPSLLEMLQNTSRHLDGAYCLVYLNACGEMAVARDPLGIKPLCYAVEGPLFAAASESVPLTNLGFRAESIRSVEPGEVLTISEAGVQHGRLPAPSGRAHCFFEWVYFANVASSLDNRSVYLTRTALGAELARIERGSPLFDLDDDTIVVPVPDTSKAAADSMAYELGIACREGLIRNRYTGRTFIEGSDGRQRAAQLKYTPLREVLDHKRVLLVEDSIVRSTTMQVLLRRMREETRVREIHVRVACPPIVSPCFYGIDMSTVSELFATRYIQAGETLDDEISAQMAADLGADSLRYLPIESVARSIGRPADELCQACTTGDYPTPAGLQLYQIASQATALRKPVRTYEA